MVFFAIIKSLLILLHFLSVSSQQLPDHTVHMTSSASSWNISAWSEASWSESTYANYYQELDTPVHIIHTGTISEEQFNTINTIISKFLVPSIGLIGIINNILCYPIVG